MLSPRLLAAPQTNDILVEVVDVKVSAVLMTGWRKAPLISEMLAARVIPPELGVCLSETESEYAYGCLNFCQVEGMSGTTCETLCVDRWGLMAIQQYAHPINKYTHHYAQNSTV